MARARTTWALLLTLGCTTPAERAPSPPSPASVSTRELPPPAPPRADVAPSSGEPPSPREPLGSPETWLADADRCPDNVSWERRPPGACIAADATKIWTQRIDFAPEKALLTSESLVALDGVVALLVAYPQIMRLEIQGHTNILQHDDHGAKLSDQRAEAVRRYLIEGGIDGARLDAKGYGMAAPIASSKTSKGLALNLRIELVVRVLGRP